MDTLQKWWQRFRYGAAVGDEVYFEITRGLRKGIVVAIFTSPFKLTRLGVTSDGDDWEILRWNLFRRVDQ